MTRTTQRPPDAHGPQRFADRAPARQPVRRSPAEVVGGVLALGLLLVGLPVALVLLAGPPPIPTSFGSLDGLADQLSIEDLLTVLVGVVWLVWLWFVVCVVVEVVAARRGGLAGRIPLAGPLQNLARVLVGLVVLTGVVAGPAQAVTAPAPSHSDSVTRVVEAPQASFVADSAEAASLDAGDRQARDDQADHRDGLVGKKVYVVAAPKHGYHDNLWDIAEKHLGDGRRYHEIYHLNHDRVQSDGGRLELARLIQPGWQLVMPEDAVNVDRVRAPEPKAPATPAPSGSSSAGSAQTDGAAAAATGDVDRLEEAGQAQSSDAWWIGAGMLAASVLGALARLRRGGPGRAPDASAREVEAELRVAATGDRVHRLDVTLRDLTARCREAGTTPPSAYAALVDDDAVELLLAPPAPDAVAGWEALEDGARWRTTATPSPVTGESAPYPALVGLGTDEDGRDVLIDMEVAGGVVSLAGDATVGAQVAAAIAVGAATAPWSDAVRVTTTDLPGDVAGIVDHRLRVADLGTEIDRIEAVFGDLDDDVLSGRMSRRGLLSHLIVCGHAPDEMLAERLGALVAGGRRRAFSVLVAGEHRDARWRLQVDEHGTMSAPQLGLTLSANRVTAREVAAVAELFQAGRAETDQAADRVAISEPAVPHDDAAWTTAPRRVGVLGRVAVQGAGDIAPERSDAATEMVAYLALHPDGVHPTVLGGAIWPRGVTVDVRDATVERVREWLGSDADGSHVLREDQSGRLSLSDSVVCDWDALRTLFLRARSAAAPGEEAELLRRGLQLVRAEPFADVPQGRFGWVARDALPREMTEVVVDGARRLAELMATGDPDGARAAAEAGLRARPADQHLWRAVIRAAYATDGIAGVQGSLESMGDALDGATLEAETEALLDELMPTGPIAAGG